MRAGAADSRRARVLVAKAALDDGHEVAVCASRSTPSWARGATIYASGMSAKARDVPLDGKAEPAMPNRLVELTLEHDRVLSY